MDPDYVARIRQQVTSISARDIRDFAIHDIDADYVVQMRQHFPTITARDIQELGIHAIDPDYVAALRQHIPDLTTHDIRELGIHQISPEWITSIQEKLAPRGITPTTKDLIAMHLHDFDPAFIDELRRIGFDVLPLRLIIELWAYNVDAFYIEEVRAAGHEDITAEELINMRRSERRTYERQIERIHEDLHDLGFRHFSTGDILDLLALGIDTAYLHQLQSEQPGISLHDVINRRRSERRA